MKGKSSPPSHSPSGIGDLIKRAHPEIRAMLHAAHEQRFRVSRTNSHHFKVMARVRSKDGRKTGGIVVVPCTPSDYHSVGNTRSALRRIGVTFSGQRKK